MVFLVPEFEVPIGQFNPIDYVREMQIDVCDYGEGMATLLVGRVEAYLVQWQDMLDDFPDEMGDALDDLSEDLGIVFNTFHNSNGPLFEPLGIDEPHDPVLVITRIVLHSDAVGCRSAVIEALSTLFGGETLTVSWRGIGGSTDAELKDLGFHAIPKSKMIWKHSILRSRFGDDFPRGEEVELEPTEEHEEWVLAEWKK